jgi:hypothetical protein
MQHHENSGTTQILDKLSFQMDKISLSALFSTLLSLCFAFGATIPPDMRTNFLILVGLSALISNVVLVVTRS